MKLQFSDELLKPETQQSTEAILPTPIQEDSNQVNTSSTTYIPVASVQTEQAVEVKQKEFSVQPEIKSNTQFPDEPIDIPAIGESDTNPEVPIPLNSPQTNQNTSELPEPTDEKVADESVSPDALEEKEEVKIVPKVGVSKFFIIGLVAIAILSGLSYALILTPLGMYVGLIPNNSVTSTTIYSHSPEGTTFQFGVTTIPSSQEPSTDLTRDAQRKRNLNDIKVALDAYYLANNIYPTSSGEEKISNGSVTGLKLIPDYIESIPMDPRNESEYSYAYKSDDGTTFMLKSRLENGQDPAGKTENGLIFYILTN